MKEVITHTKKKEGNYSFSINTIEISGQYQAEKLHENFIPGAKFKLFVCLMIKPLVIRMSFNQEIGPEIEPENKTERKTTKSGSLFSCPFGHFITEKSPE